MLLEKNGSVSIQKFFQIFPTEMYKVSKDLSLSTTVELLTHRNKQDYNLRNNAEFTIPV